MQYSFGHFEPFDTSLNLVSEENAIANSEIKPVESIIAPEAKPEIVNAKNTLILRALKNVEEQIKNITTLLEHDLGSEIVIRNLNTKPDFLIPLNRGEGKVVEGAFDGRNMIGADGATYPIPANYASKSKLVEGDLLKLTITPTGAFIYKQVGPADRNRIVAVLGYDDTMGEFYAATEDKRWNILRASVTYYKGEVGDEIILLIPAGAPSAWAAVENIVKTNTLRVQNHEGEKVFESSVV